MRDKWNERKERKREGTNCDLRWKCLGHGGRFERAQCRSMPASCSGWWGVSERARRSASSGVYLGVCVASQRPEKRAYASSVTGRGGGGGGGGGGKGGGGGGGGSKRKRRRRRGRRRRRREESTAAAVIEARRRDRWARGGMGARGWAPLSCRGPSRLPRPPPSSGSTGTPLLPRTDSQLPRNHRRARLSGPAPVEPNLPPKGPLGGVAKRHLTDRSGLSFVYPLRIPCAKCASTLSSGSILFSTKFPSQGLFCSPGGHPVKRKLDRVNETMYLRVVKLFFFFFSFFCQL